jgi:uncharacterized protein
MTYFQKLAIILLFLCNWTTLSHAATKDGASLKVNTIIATTRTKVSGFIEIEAGNDQTTRIPVTIFNGQRTGPTISLIGGTHGYEYAPIIALQNVAQQIDPMSLSGNIIIVHVANMPSFLGRTIYYSPVDKKNLNRAYPGDEQGSITERITHAITTEIIEQSDYLVDMHSGDGNEALRPYIYMPHTGNQDLDTTIKEMALSFGIDHIIIDRTPVTAPESSTFTDMTALSRGIPAMTTEIGGAGSTDAHWVDKNIKGINNLLRHLKILPGEVQTFSPPVWLEDYTVVTSPDTGIFKPEVRDGYIVAKGGTLGHLVDFFGTPIAEITAPFAGVINYVIITPPVTKGEPLVMLSHIKVE